MAYKIAGFGLANPVNAQQVAYGYSLTCDGLVDFSQYKKQRPVIYYIDDHENVYNISNMTTVVRTVGANSIYYGMQLKPDIGLAVPPMYGIYLMYNPTDKTNNIGVNVAESGTTEVDFETLQKYAPWPIAAPVT